MFPFSRGLVHSFWAPNLWAIYLTLDKILAQLFRSILMLQSQTESTSTLKLLPNISPSFTLILIGIFILPVLYSVVRKNNFGLHICGCGLTFFMFGFHVHEKAITPYLNLLLVVLGIDNSLLNSAIFVNIINLTPLLIDPEEKVLKFVFAGIWVVIMMVQREDKKQEKYMSFEEKIQQGVILSGFAVLAFQEILFPFLKRPKIEFIPLMMNSFWAACCNLYFLIQIQFQILKNDH